ncbi:DUF3293 domain-containing protein [Gallaecimonas sp. GXIMD1310]|uniref:DUF3293 domain-containing protein n=1 Tax=Gallaecimonas sp. GXIMD1310 TaxID=3131926 RepID=UPI00324FDAE9
MTLWASYENAVFMMPKPFPKRWDFAVITACNPRSKVLSDQFNDSRDRQLEAELDLAGLDARPLWGCSPDWQYREKSWAVRMSQAQAEALGRRLEQNAIYWVSQDLLYLVPCLLHSRETCVLGRFSERCYQP